MARRESTARRRAAYAGLVTAVVLAAVTAAPASPASAAPPAPSDRETECADAGGTFTQRSEDVAECTVEAEDSRAVPGSHPHQLWQAVLAVTTTTRHTSEIVNDDVALRSHRTERASEQQGCLNPEGTALGGNAWKRNPNCQPADPVRAHEHGPSVEITSPTNGQEVAKGSEVILTATATDAEGNSLGDSIEWSYANPFQPGPPTSLDSGSTVSLPSDIPVGIWVITAAVTDTAGLSASTQRWFRVNSAGPSAIVAGTRHTCALLDGSVYCWGDNAWGQLGRDPATILASAVPLPVEGLGSSDGRSATAISAGLQHTCALLDDGSVRCWGENDYGQVGAPENGGGQWEPVTVPSLGSVTAIAAGASHTCALLETRHVTCWGDGSLMQYQPNSSGQPWVPSEVMGGATAIAAGGLHTCALVDDGGIRCWGLNAYGQLGNPVAEGSVSPVAVNWPESTEPTATAITAGFLHTCAVLDGGAVRCWGGNGSGQLGVNPTTTAYVGPLPSSVTPLSVDWSGDEPVVTAVSANAFHTCAVLDDGSARCWGDNGDGQLGGTDLSFSWRPVTVSWPDTEPPTVRTIAAGSFHTCAVLHDGSVSCWGRNTHGQLGNGSFVGSRAPVRALDFG